MRNFGNHILYISFPKFANGEEEASYNRRYYKKIMYNFMKPEPNLIDFN